MPEFVKDVEELRKRAINKIEEGPVTQGYGLDVEKSVAILNEALATEIVCVLRYMHHYFMATGLHGKSVADEFKEHADAEREHADRIAERIQQLGGKPDFNPRSLVERSVSHYIEGEDLADMIREDLIAERVVIEVYTDMIRHFGDKDPTTRRMIEEILEDEEEHAADLTDLLYVVDPTTGKTEGQDPGTRPLMQGTGREQGGAQEAPGASARVADIPPSRGRRQPVSAEMTRSGERGEMVAARQGKVEFARRGEPVPPAHQPGTTGHPTRPRPQQTEDAEVDESVDAGAHRGSTRAVRVTKPNRKKRAA